MLAKTSRWTCSQHAQSLAQLLQAGPGPRETGVVAVDDAQVSRNDRGRCAEGADILGDDNPAFSYGSLQDTPVVSSAKPRPVRC